ncbi:MAG: sugar ABC transporter permease [Candidatus Melainabacteria bacterium RIFOXYA12_FULL_32_12]|nr:MAG: sugar ABC transporter permease [Candidatus Melainabacteria bacterium RIFOXYA2_FULL_32_9]OGI29178.1 MAG: sugar ABC transporter permease [Candidatus Melainabacteria bacterium RIFOXYA12_FULL_32_12]
MINKLKKLNIKEIIAYLILTIGAVSMLVPFLWMVATSFMGQKQIFSYPPALMPNPFIISNYYNVTKVIPVAQYFFNSAFVAILTTVGQVIIASMAAYAFARLKFKGRDALFLILLATMMIPPQVNIVPLFFVMRELHWINTYQALIVPGLFGGFGIFLLRQWFKGLPADLEDAAKIDGCNPLQTYWKIAMPLALPAIATLGIFTFITTWNSFMWPLIVTNSDTMRTLPVGLAVFKGSFRETTEWGQLMACALIAVIPVVGVFLLGQKYFIKGIMMGGVKE